MDKSSSADTPVNKQGYPKTEGLNLEFYLPSNSNRVHFDRNFRSLNINLPPAMPRVQHQCAWAFTRADALQKGLVAAKPGLANQGEEDTGEDTGPFDSMDSTSNDYPFYPTFFITTLGKGSPGLGRRVLDY